MHLVMFLEFSVCPGKFSFISDDHIILNSDDFRGFIPRQLVVRTVTDDNRESCDSETVKLPQSLISEITEGAAKTVSKDTPNKVVQVQHVREKYRCFMHIKW